MSDDADADSTERTAPVRGKRPAQGEPVIDRAFSILHSFDPSHRHLGLNELSRRAGLPVSSTLRIARQLMSWGALERDEHGRFCIGVRLYELAASAPRGHGIRNVALPFLHDLAEATRQHVLLAVRDGHEAILLERISDHQAMPVLYHVGGRLPLHSTGVGLALLAFESSQFRESYLSRSLVRMPEQQPVDATQLRRLIAEIRREKSVIFRRRVPTPILSVAAPVWGADEQLAGAISVVVPDDGYDPRRLLPALQTSSKSLSRVLGAGLPAVPSGDA